MAKLYKLTILSANKTFEFTNKSKIRSMCKLTNAQVNEIIKHQNHKDYLIEQTTTEIEELKKHFQSLRKEPKEIRVREKMPLCSAHGMCWVYTKKTQV